MPLVNAVLSGEVSRLPGELQAHARGVAQSGRRAAGVRAARRAAGPARRPSSARAAGSTTCSTPSRRRTGCSGATGATSASSSQRWNAAAARAAGAAARRPAPRAARQQPGGRAAAGAGAGADRPPGRRAAADGAGLPFTHRASIWQAMPATRFHSMPDGRRIAFRHVAATGPAVVFLPGYMSDMAGSKATALFDWAAAQGRDCLLLDYSGCGESSGDFAEGTLSRWREEVARADRAPGRRARWCWSARRWAAG